jgi:hypothetical protein
MRSIAYGQIALLLAARCMNGGHPRRTERIQRMFLDETQLQNVMLEKYILMILLFFLLV